ncbi:uncharacterized protein [Amphiura filiformis]|uniref:uncharacterized protein n=1 Tax=Amphiura filiformis TaxID=82378 RepID=UPI003B216DE2
MAAIPDWKRQLQENVAKKRGVEPPRSVVIISKKGTSTTSTTNNNIRGSAPKIGVGGQNSTTSSQTHNNNTNRNSSSSVGHRRTFVSSKPTDEFLQSKQKVNINDIRTKYDSPNSSPRLPHGKVNEAGKASAGGSNVSSSNRTSSVTSSSSSSPRGSPQIARSSSTKGDPYNSKTATKITSNSRPKSFHGTSSINQGSRGSSSPKTQRNVTIKQQAPKAPVQSSASAVKISVTKPPNSPKTKSKSPFGALKSMVKSKASPPTSPTTKRSVLGNANSQTNKSNVSLLKNKQQVHTKSAPVKSVARYAAEEVPLDIIENTSSDSDAVVLVRKKELAVYETQDAGRTPPPRRKKKNPLPASAIISIDTAGPIQAASGKPALDPERIAKEKAASVPATQKSNSKVVAKKQESAVKSNAKTVPSLDLSKSEKASGDRNVPYPEDFRRPKSFGSQNGQSRVTVPSPNLKRREEKRPEPPKDSLALKRKSKQDHDRREVISPIPGRAVSESLSPIPTPFSPPPDGSNHANVNVHTLTTVDEKEEEKDFSGVASDEIMRRSRGIQKEKIEVNYVVIGGNEKTGKPSILKKSDGKKKTTKNKLALTFQEEPEEFEYQSEQSLLAEYGDEGEEEEDAGRHSSVSEDEEPSSPVAPAPSGFRENVPKATGGLQSFTPSYLRDLTPSMMREHQEALRRKDEAPKLPEPEPQPSDARRRFLRQLGLVQPPCCFNDTDEYSMIMNIQQCLMNI